MSVHKATQERLYELMVLPCETEWIEFKEAKNNYDFDDLGKYFSALSNEANLNEQPAGWLVFGVTNKLPRHVVGTNYRHQQPGLEKLRRQGGQACVYAFREGSMAEQTLSPTLPNEQ